MSDTKTTYVIIGAGPMGLATAKVFKQLGIPFKGFELSADVGGLWNINAPLSTMYETAHLISSKTMTEFADFPMDEDVAEYPSHKDVKAYFDQVADHFGLRQHYAFNAEVTKVEPLGDDGDGWRVDWTDADGAAQSAVFAGVLIANGTLSEPNVPTFEGSFDGEFLHASKYKSPRQFDGKRVLVVGAGNSGCDIAVDAIHHGESCDISMRRGYYFVPKYVFGKPADTVGGAIKLPMWLKRKVDRFLLSWFVGDPQKYGFPKPDYQLYESHPIVNSLILFHAGHGDIKVRRDIARVDGKTVHFKDGEQADYDMILAATGYKLHYPFIDKKWLNWQGDAPHLYLNCMHPERDDVFVMGMVEASGLGWHGRHDQAEMVARFILSKGKAAAQALHDEKAKGFSRATGGMDYLDLPRMAYYVDKATYLKSVKAMIRKLGGAA